MHYLVLRNGQTYGPYTLEDLQRYVTSGNVLLTDIAQPQDAAGAPADPTAAPITVAQLLGVQTPAAAATPPAGGAYPPPGFASPYAPLAASPYPPPPNLSWGLVLLFDILTCSFFQLIWNIILAAWFHRVMPTSRALWLYIASAALILTQAVLGQAVGFMAGAHGIHGRVFHGGSTVSYGFIAILCWVVRLVARFTFRSELEQHYNSVEPIGLHIDPVLTFFFGGIYLQSVMNRINETRTLPSFGVYPR